MGDTTVVTFAPMSDAELVKVRDWLANRPSLPPMFVNNTDDMIRRLLATIDRMKGDSEELKARQAFELAAEDPESRSNSAIAWAYHELTGRKAWSKGAVADIIAEQFDRAEKLLDLLRAARPKMATYVGVYPGDKELRRLLSEWDAALAGPTPKPQ